MPDRKRLVRLERTTDGKSIKRAIRRLKTRKRAGKKAPELQDYEPPTRPLSKMLVRSVFLRLLTSEMPQAVTSLFEGCYSSYLRLQHHSRPPVISGEAPYTEADTFQFGEDEFRDYSLSSSLKRSEESHENQLRLLETIQLAGWNADEQLQAVEASSRLVEDIRQFHQALSAWRKECQMEGGATDWFCDFGVRVLRHFWEAYDKPKPLPVRPARPSLDSIRVPLAPLASTSLRSRPLVSELARPDEVALESSLSRRAVPGFGRNPSTQIARPQSGLATQTNNDAMKTDKMKVAWNKAIFAIEEESRLRMKAPENALDNIFERQSVASSLFGSALFRARPSRFLQPEERPIQAPAAPDGLPTIGGEQDQGNVCLFRSYQWRVRLQLENLIESSAMRYLTEKQQERVVRQSLQASFPAMADYWQRYGRHLQKCGWKAVLKKDDLEKHCKWLLWNLDGKTHQNIARKADTGKSNITKRINEIKPLLGLTNATGA